mgnify:CR=1 FL=1
MWQILPIFEIIANTDINNNTKQQHYEHSVIAALAHQSVRD